MTNPAPIAPLDIDTAFTDAARSDAPRDLVDRLYRQASDEADRDLAKFDGCFDFWPETATPVALSEPAVLGSTDGSLLAVLIPGRIAALDAATLAIEVARESGATIDSSDPSLYVEIHPARWLVLNHCESDTHDFHPELAPLGERTVGAILATRVVFTSN